MPRASTKVFKKRRGVFNKGRCNKSNDGCGESNSTVPKNSADGAKLCTKMKLNHLPKCYSYENYALNTRLVYAMRCIDKGAESARMFCGIMNLPPPPTKFSKYNHILLQATRETCEHSMAEAVREAVDENDGKRDLAVAFDGSWQKRGFSSKNGLVTVTSVDTGKVIDVEVFSKHCICPNKTKHLQNCKRNFEGYSGKMEVAGALSVFQRSQSLYNVRYTKYLGDGDSKAFTSIVENKVYGDYCSVEKLECIGDVMKRMGTRLRRLKTKMRGQKLSDGKPLCGRNRLTEAEIDRLQAYYGLAIRRNLSSVKDMQQAIWAIFLHKLSTDEKPQHGFFPSDTDTWDLANPELLKKCLHGGTQNPNESVNNVIWSRAPKKTFVQLEVLSLGTYDAVSSFNMGNVSKLEILRKMCIEPGDYTVQAMECLDKQRLLRAKYYCLQKTKEVRKEKRLKRKKEDDELLKNADDLEYGGGMF
ncbi:uncharacterized protein TNCV_2570911 [Trichonephila clavipes]|nr:uncharacterized protein TNCV_2570911 [Trichonephila clavipes]